MPFKVVILPQAKRQISTWQLPDFVFVEVYIQLCENLPKNPPQYLKREESSFDGMVYRLGMIDPDNRFCEHFLHFKYFTAQTKKRSISRAAVTFERPMFRLRLFTRILSHFFQIFQQLAEPISHDRV